MLAEDDAAALPPAASGVGEVLVVADPTDEVETVDATVAAVLSVVPTDAILLLLLLLSLLCRVESLSYSTGSRHEARMQSSRLFLFEFASPVDTAGWIASFVVLLVVVVVVVVATVASRFYAQTSRRSVGPVLVGLVQRSLCLSMTLSLCVSVHLSCLYPNNRQMNTLQFLQSRTVPVVVAHFFFFFVAVVWVMMVAVTIVRTVVCVHPPRLCLVLRVFFFIAVALETPPKRTRRKRGGFWVFLPRVSLDRVASRCCCWCG